MRLIEDGGWRSRCRAIDANADLDAAFFAGEPALFCKAIAGLVWPNPG
jgi:hypothetical protein